MKPYRVTEEDMDELYLFPEKVSEGMRDFDKRFMMLANLVKRWVSKQTNTKERG